MKVFRWLLPLVSLVLVVGFTLWDLRGSRIGPGPLHPAHIGLPELDKGRNCEACHREGAGIDANACGKCHAAVAEQIASGRGLHGGMPAGQRERCGACHSDHHGDSAPLLAAHAFALAGVAADTYDHRHVDWHLTGAHAGVACKKCHLAADESVPPKGGRFLGLSQTCTECHADEHHDAFGKDCESCHGQAGPWKATPGFRHETFALRDAHQKVACAECHRPGSPNDVAAEKRDPPKQARQCAACHADPHGSAGKVTALQLNDTADCARCHAATKWSTARPTAETHGGSKWPLRGVHADVACAVCHGDRDHRVRWTGAAPALASCAACHEHPHGAALMQAAVAATGPADGCAGCHGDADHDFRGGRLEPQLHQATGFALVLPHADVACDKCHTGTERTQRFPGRAQAECRKCHADVHRGQFDHEKRYGECTACHRPTTFRPSEFGIAAHTKTPFPLTGAHDAVACGKCHGEVKDGVRTFHGTPQQCVACHRDVHEGTFDRAGRPRQIAGRTDCARCHDTAAFAPVAGGFDHTLWTGWELAGAHTKVDCTACHPRTNQGATKASRLGRAAGTGCANCHADPHAAQFVRGGATDCARCHGVDSFRIEKFDHKTTRFPLDDVHAKVTCAECHKSYGTPQGHVVRYKPLGTTCGDCHALGVPKGGKR